VQAVGHPARGGEHGHAAVLELAGPEPRERLVAERRALLFTDKIPAVTAADNSIGPVTLDKSVARFMALISSRAPPVISDWWNIA
jgi:hypothetical protein